MTTEPGDDELEVSDLRPESKRERGAGPRGVRRVLRQRVWRWTPLALSLALLVALAVSALPQAKVLVWALQAFGRAPTLVAVPHAGCYQLRASWPASSGPGSIWPAGSWQAIVSVGR